MNYYNPYQPNYNQNFNNTYQQPQQQVCLPLAIVNGYEEAKKYIVMPNQTIYLRDNQNQDIMYIKSVNSQGMVSLQVKKLIDYENESKTVFKDNQIDLSSYATKTEIEALRKEIEALKGGISNE